MTSFREALAARPLLLDGGLATHLETLGHDLSDDLWSARLLRDDPAAVVRAHTDHVVAGAEVLVTASYQAGVDALVAAGATAEQARGLIASSVARAREAAAAAPHEVWVAGSVGPYGALLADGQEYAGDYLDPTSARHVPTATLRRVQRERMTLLVEAGADVLACETLPGLAEAELLVALAEELDADVWVSLTAVLDGDGRLRSRRGEPLEPALRDLDRHPRVVAAGVNCCAPAVADAAAAAGAGVVYPNSGETWDGAARRWRGAPALLDGLAAGWLAAGARLVGGCCRVTPAHVAAMAQAVRRVDPRDPEPRG